jgi:prepilin-type N-terminal cleavage/methylation domain-containing protein
VNTEPRRRVNPANGGFTLIEVMIALVILAVGLLGLEAMSIAAAKLTARAAATSEYTSRAGTQMEGIITRIQMNDATLTSPYCPSSTAMPSPSGRTLARMRTCATKVGNGWTVTVTVLPQSIHPALTTRDSIRLTANVFDPI